MFRDCEFKANNRVDFFNHVPEHDGDEQVKVVELSNVAFAINI